MKKVMVFTVVVSMLFLGVPAPTDAGVLAGVATEWTQILNHVQLIMGYIRQGLQLENELRQYAEQLKQGRVLPQQLFGPIQQDLSQLSQVVQGGQALHIRWVISTHNSAIPFRATAFAARDISTTTRSGRRLRSTRR